MDSIRVVLTRVIGLAVLPASLPGNAPGLLEELGSAPLKTVRTWKRSLIVSLLRQIIGCRKLEVPDDRQLQRLAAARARYVQRGWEHVQVSTADGLLLDAMCVRPGAAGGGVGRRRQSVVAERFVLWVGGNFQKYEDWLSYFDLYARDAGVGFFAFNFRGVGLSEGAVLCADDLLADVAACVRHLHDARGVTAERLLLHGFSLGGSIAALYLAQPDAPRCALISDRSFRSLAHAAHNLIRGPDEEEGAPPSEQQGPATRTARTSSSAVSSSPSGAAYSAVDSPPASLAARLAKRRNAAVAWFLQRLLRWCRTVCAAIAVAALRGLGWELFAEEALEHVAGRRLIIFHREDDVVHYEGASLEAALQRKVHIGNIDIDIYMHT